MLLTKVPPPFPAKLPIFFYIAIIATHTVKPEQLLSNSL